MKRTAFLGLVLALTACGGGDDDDHDAALDGGGGLVDATLVDAAPAAIEERSFTFGEGIFVEASFDAGPGDQVRAIMTASAAALIWNIHGHVGDEVITFHEEADVAASDFTFEPEAQGEYYFLIGNNGEADLDVDVTIQLFGAATFGAWFE